MVKAKIKQELVLTRAFLSQYEAIIINNKVWCSRSPLHLFACSRRSSSVQTFILLSCCKVKIPRYGLSNVISLSEQGNFCQIMTA